MLGIEPERLAWRETGSEIVVLDLRGSVYFGLNPTAARLWKMLAAGATRGALVARLVDEQQVDAGRAEDDVAIVAVRCSAQEDAPAPAS